MSMQRKSICFTELKQTMAILEECNTLTHSEFVTQYINFATVCLCRAVLLVCLHSHRYHHGSSDVPDDENMLLIKSFSV